MKPHRGLAAIAAALLLAGCVSTTTPTGMQPATTAAAATTPDTTLQPTYGSVQLAAGASHTMQLQAGGPIEASAIGAHCIGFIYEAPDVAIDRTGAGPLLLTAISREDTTLVVLDPQGRFHCNDDVAGTLDSQLRIVNAGPGRYLIWVGTYWQLGAYPDATLRID